MYQSNNIEFNKETLDVKHKASMLKSISRASHLLDHFNSALNKNVKLKFDESGLSPVIHSPEGQWISSDINSFRNKSWNKDAIMDKIKGRFKELIQKYNNHIGSKIVLSEDDKLYYKGFKSDYLKIYKNIPWQNLFDTDEAASIKKSLDSDVLPSLDHINI